MSERIGSWDDEVDIAIVGGGACGSMAAIRAARNSNLVVAVFEKSVRNGSNAAISSGSLAAGGTRFQDEARITDSPRQHAEDILAASGDEQSRPVVEALCEVAPTIVEWLADSGYPVELGVDMSRAGMTVPRLHTDVGRQGGGRLIRHLHRLLDDYQNVALVDEATVTELVSSQAGLTGVVVEQNGQSRRVGARSVVLATDGFAGNPSLTKEHLPHLGTPFYGGVDTSTGESLAWATELGAQLRNMSAALRSGLVVADYGTRVSPALQFNGAVLINSRGERFVDEESKGYSSMAGILQEQPGEQAAMVFDATAMTKTRESEMMRACLAAGAIRDLPTLADVATALGLSSADTERALDPLPDRRRLSPPYHLAWVTHGLLATQGGVVIDTQGRVLNGDDEPIPQLYAGGGAACGLSGDRSSGYISGNGLLSAFGMGWIIGTRLATVSSQDG